MFWNSVYRFDRHKQLTELVDWKLIWVNCVHSVLGSFVLNHLQISFSLRNSHDFWLHISGDVHLLVHMPDCLGRM
jgi:hypothetical protein